ncbi:MAG: dephospho-CoA kinase [Candidatus Paracaedibacteraceae bacterium]|nr:dephospho-CoA kinase [Candidatus Paracaedibacteraceae bacterium]
MMIILGITGSMASGKSSLTHRARTLLHIPVWDADRDVQSLYQKKTIQQKILALFPSCASHGQLDRDLLKGTIAQSPDNLLKIEAILYPELAQSREKFLSFHQKRRSPCVILDIPLLFEKDLDSLCDWTIVTTSPDWLIHQRILKRPTMTATLMHSLLSKQLPQIEKQQRADFIIDSGAGHHHTWIQFMQILEHLGL